MIPLLVAVLVTVADQATKWVIRDSFVLGEARTILAGFFDLTYVRNTGAAWGMFRGYGGVLIGLSILVLVLMLVFHKSFVSDAREHQIAFGLLLGGIVGNLIDRIKLGYVVDFLDVYVGNHHWPAFNIADSAICIGVGVYILSSLWLTSHPLHGTDDEVPDPALGGE